MQLVRLGHGIPVRHRVRNPGAGDADRRHVSPSHGRRAKPRARVQDRGSREHTVVAANSLVKIDPDFPLVSAALLACAVPTGYGSAARRANIRGGDTAVVIGAGGIGTAAIQGAHISGAARIVAIDVSEFKRESAPRFGATHTAAAASEAIEMVRELTHGVMADAVVVSPAMIGEADVWAALTLTRKGGTCVLTGLPSPATHSIAVTLREFILMNKTLCGTVFGSCTPGATFRCWPRCTGRVSYFSTK
jgi:Zn-dependent alcohol dehydrogenase